MPPAAVVPSTGREACSTTVPPPWVSAGGLPLTRTTPDTMFIPHAKRYSPVSVGRNSTAVVRNAGSAALTLKSGMTTREVHSPLSCRSNRSLTGTPGRTPSITSGL